MVLTPWDVKGDVNYEKVMVDFGVKPLLNLPEVFTSNVLFRRKKIFAHRDFKPVVEAILEKKPFIMMTGLMPTGKFHIGHMILARQMIFYQSLGATIYIAVADIEAYNARNQSLEESRLIAIDQYIKNYIAMGLKPENCVIYFQSDRSANAQTSVKYYQLQNILARHITFNEFKAVYGEITPGKMLSALLQASDMLHPQLLQGRLPTVIPVGIDQDPHIRLTRDVSKRVKMFDFTQISSTYHQFVPGLGGGKMSASDDTSFIAMTDDATTIKKKVNKYAFSGGQPTLEEHRKLGGNPDIDIPYQWLTFLEEDDDELIRVYNEYKSGKLLSGELKAIVIEKLAVILTEHQKKREAVTQKDVDAFFSD